MKATFASNLITIELSDFPFCSLNSKFSLEKQIAAYLKRLIKNYCFSGVQYISLPGLQRLCCFFHCDQAILQAAVIQLNEQGFHAEILPKSVLFNVNHCRQDGKQNTIPCSGVRITGYFKNLHEKFIRLVQKES